MKPSQGLHDLQTLQTIYEGLFGGKPKPSNLHPTQPQQRIRPYDSTGHETIYSMFRNISEQLYRLQSVLSEETPELASAVEELDGQLERVRYQVEQRINNYLDGR